MQARELWERKKTAIDTNNKKELDLARVRYDAELKAIRKQNEDSHEEWGKEIARLQHEIQSAKARFHWACYRIYWVNNKRRQGARFAWHAEVSGLWLLFEFLLLRLEPETP